MDTLNILKEIHNRIGKLQEKADKEIFDIDLTIDTLKFIDDNVCNLHNYIKNRPPNDRTEAFEDAAQIVRYYLKHQNYPSDWNDMDEYQKAVTVTCDNLVKLILEKII